MNSKVNSFRKIVNEKEMLKNSATKQNKATAKQEADGGRRFMILKR